MVASKFSNFYSFSTFVALFLDIVPKLTFDRWNCNDALQLSNWMWLSKK